MPEPWACEAIVFRDFFVAGLRFPLEKFVSDVLTRFDCQLHQLTPNSISRLGVFAMCMKMAGCDLNVYVFTRFYKIKQWRNKVTNPETGKGGLC